MDVINTIDNYLIAKYHLVTTNRHNGRALKLALENITKHLKNFLKDIIVKVLWNIHTASLILRTFTFKKDLLK